MKVVRQFVLMLAVLLPLLAPVMACALPNADMSPAENACCQQMQGQCGNMDMPVSHNCCHKEVPAVAHWNAAIPLKPANIQTDSTMTAGLTRAAFVPPSVVALDRAQWPGSTQPQSPPSAISILRI